MKMAKHLEGGGVVQTWTLARLWALRNKLLSYSITSLAMRETLSLLHFALTAVSVPFGLQEKEMAS